MNNFKKWLFVLFAVLISALNVYADSAKQVDFLLSGYDDPTSHRPLSGGKVWTFLDGTSTLAPVWTDKDKGGVAANPVILDSSGKAEIYGDNIYKFVIYDDEDVLVQEIPGLEYKSVLTPSIENIASLRLSPGEYAGQSVQVLGYYEAGDGGGGDFYWSDENLSTSVTTDTESGLFIAPNTDLTGASGAWVRIYSGNPLVEYFGIFADATAEFIVDKWVFTPGTDQGAKINNVLNYVRNLQFGDGVYWITTTIKLKGGTALLGLNSAFGWGKSKETSRLVFGGAPDANCIEADTDLFEVSHYRIKNMRIDDGRTSPTAGWGVFANRAVNSQYIEDCFINVFPSGSIFVGADTNDRAADNIAISRVWVFPGSVSHIAIGIGNFNNTLSIRDIYGGGDGTMIQRINGNDKAGIMVIEGVQHETTGNYPTLSTATGDRVFATGITRRSSAGTTGATIKPVSINGSYTNILHTSTAGTVSEDTFQDGSGNTISQGANYIPRQGASSFLGAIQDANYVDMEFTSSDQPFISMFQNSVERIRLSSFDISHLRYYRDNDPIFIVHNTAGTSATAMRAVTGSGGGTGAAIDLDRTTSDGRFINMARNGVTKFGIYAGAGSPEGVITAATGSTYHNYNGGAGTTFYVKETGTGNTGWVGK